MDIWIRSQDKLRLTSACDFRIVYLEKENKWAIDCCDYIGFYSTQEKAIKVLDEINDLMKPKMIVKYNGLLSEKDKQKFTEETRNIIIDGSLNLEHIQSTLFYQMPSDEEVII